VLDPINDFVGNIGRYTSPTQRPLNFTKWLLRKSDDVPCLKHEAESYRPDCPKCQVGVNRLAEGEVAWIYCAEQKIFLMEPRQGEQETSEERGSRCWAKEISTHLYNIYRKMECDSYESDSSSDPFDLYNLMLESDVESNFSEGSLSQSLSEALSQALSQASSHRSTSIDEGNVTGENTPTNPEPVGRRSPVARRLLQLMEEINEAERRHQLKHL